MVHGMTIRTVAARSLGLVWIIPSDLQQTISKQISLHYLTIYVPPASTVSYSAFCIMDRVVFFEVWTELSRVTIRPLFPGHALF